MDITPLRFHSSTMNCFSKVICLRVYAYNELKFHISCRDGKMLALLRGIKISISSKVDIAPLCCKPPKGFHITSQCCMWVIGPILYSQDQDQVIWWIQRCNCMPIFYRFRDITIYWSQICVFAVFTTPVSFEALAMRFPFNIGYKSNYQKT